MKKFDERDIIFARLNYKPGSPQYADYYSRNPDMKEADDRFRSKPPMGTHEATQFDPLNSRIPDACFAFLAAIKPFAEGIPNSERVEVSPSELTKKLKGLAMYYDARLVGITEMSDELYYEFKGRPDELYGKPPEPRLPYGIAFAVEMERDMFFCAPRLPESIAVTKGYISAAVVGMVLSYYLRELGYNARNHLDGNYQVPAVLVAEAAGLGEIGANNLLVTKDYGPRVRIGVVTTDAPIVPDGRRDFGIREICKECGKCSAICPAKAISPLRKKVDTDACFTMWQRLGTDCGLCIAVCPLSKTRPYIKEDPDWLIREK